MAVDTASSALFMDYQEVTGTPGSPYYMLKAVVRAGGNDYVPLQIIRWDLERNWRKGYLDNNSIVLTFGTGTVMNDLAPYGDDLKITISMQKADETGVVITDSPVVVRTYVAYFGDYTTNSVESGSNAAMVDTDTANRFDLQHVQFVLERVSVQQLRQQSVGFIGRSCPPWAVLAMFMSNATKALKMGTDEVINRFDMVPANNNTPRSHVVVPDATPLLDLADHLQNNEGGIYSTGLGFYVQDQTIYAWPMYDLSRKQTAKRCLSIVLAPNKQSMILDRTWMDKGRLVTIISSGITKIMDTSGDLLNTKGNGVRFVDAGKIMDNNGTIKDNKFTMSRSKNVNEFITTPLATGQNFAPGQAPTSNVYNEASKLAARSGAFLAVPWMRSNIDLLTPGMPVDILYTYGDEVQTIVGVLMEAYSSTKLDGQGLAAQHYIQNSSLMIFIDRNDPAYVKYLKDGGQGSPAPEMGSI